MNMINNIRVRNTFISTVLLLFMICVSNAQIINKEPLSSRITGYKIDAKLDPVTKIVDGSMEAFWVNNSSETVADIQMHLYANAYKNNKSTLYIESGFSPGGDSTAYGWIDINSFTGKDGSDLLPLIQFISPDDGNPFDRTVIKLNLPVAARPGDTVFVRIDFQTKLPSRIRRSGYTDDFFFVGQWFPKFGVYEPAGMRYRIIGGWNCHQFHENSEFYSNHSVYDVKITVPNEYVVGTGGMLISEAPGTEGTKTLTFRAEDIVDFAWTAWPGYKVFTDQWEHVKITLLIPEERTEQVARQFKAVKNALEYMTENVGPYPWPYLTFADPPSKGSGAGGMEYTTLFTSMSSYRMPEFRHIPEMTTVHEFVHAYFMGILASNEFEEPWMDEGITSFFEQRIMDHYWGENSGMIDHPMLKVSDKSSGRTSYVQSPHRQLVSNNEFSWNYPLGTYGMMSYQKAATWLQTMMGIVGEETTKEIYREYYRKWAFRHPAGRDFINVVNEVVKKNPGYKSGNDMNWFFDQVLYGTGICDYSVAGFRNNRYEKPQGDFEDADTTLQGYSYADSLYKAVVKLERLGEVMLPVDVLVHFSNGEEVLESWDGKSKVREFSYVGVRKIDWVKIDPEFRILMDVNYINNSMTDEPDRVPVKRISTKFVSFLQFLIYAITL
jgi:hypothetical protein